MNDEILELFRDFEVNGEKIPVKLLYYNGHGESYIVFMQTDADESLTGDDQLIGYADYYDFDVYTQGNLRQICEAVKKIMVEEGDYVWQLSRTSQDFFDQTTGYYHKTLSFAKERMI